MKKTEYVAIVDWLDHYSHTSTSLEQVIKDLQNTPVKCRSYGKLIDQKNNNYIVLEQNKFENGKPHDDYEIILRKAIIKITKYPIKKQGG